MKLSVASASGAQTKHAAFIVGAAEISRAIEGAVRPLHQGRFRIFSVNAIVVESVSDGIVDKAKLEFEQTAIKRAVRPHRVTGIPGIPVTVRSEEHTSELQSPMY